MDLNFQDCRWLKIFRLMPLDTSAFEFNNRYNLLFFLNVWGNFEDKPRQIN